MFWSLTQHLGYLFGSSTTCFDDAFQFPCGDLAHLLLELFLPTGSFVIWMIQNFYVILYLCYCMKMSYIFIFILYKLLILRVCRFSGFLYAHSHAIYINQSWSSFSQILGLLLCLTTGATISSIMLIRSGDTQPQCSVSCLRDSTLNCSLLQ